MGGGTFSRGGVVTAVFPAYAFATRLPRGTGEQRDTFTCFVISSFLLDEHKLDGIFLLHCALSYPPPDV